MCSTAHPEYIAVVEHGHCATQRAPEKNQAEFSSGRHRSLVKDSEQQDIGLLELNNVVTAILQFSQEGQRF